MGKDDLIATCWPVFLEKTAEERRKTKQEALSYLINSGQAVYLESKTNVSTKDNIKVTFQSSVNSTAFN